MILAQQQRDVAVPFEASKGHLWLSTISKSTNTPRSPTPSAIESEPSPTAQTSKQKPFMSLHRDTGDPTSHSVPVQTLAPSRDLTHLDIDPILSSDESMAGTLSTGERGSRRSSESLDKGLDTEHVIHLSSIEHCMPRAYIRICLAYALPSPEMLPQALEGLSRFVRQLVDAKPYLAGYIVPRNDPFGQPREEEIRFTTTDFLEFPRPEVRTLFEKDAVMQYAQLLEEGLPPSKLRPEEVAMLPVDGPKEHRAPVFRVQANLVDGGLIVSLYLHHCISDGSGLDLLVSGDVLDDDFTFRRHLSSADPASPTLTERLEVFAHQKSVMRQHLSWSSPNQVSTRHLRARRFDLPRMPTPNNGRGCVIAINAAKVQQLRDRLLTHLDMGDFISDLDPLQALVWCHMTRARLPSVADTPSVSTSKLLVPVNIRHKMKAPLPRSYFGAAIDFAMAEMDLSSLVRCDDASLAHVALRVRQAINAVDDDYVRQAIALARSTDPMIDVRDLQASNMDRARGADMYITSWHGMRVYEADLGMGLGTPDWVRKPWSRDPGSCIILPRKGANPTSIEVVVQMTKPDMERLLGDDSFREYVDRHID